MAIIKQTLAYWMDYYRCQPPNFTDWDVDSFVAYVEIGINPQGRRVGERPPKIGWAYDGVINYDLGNGLNVEHQIVSRTRGGIYVEEGTDINDVIRELTEYRIDIAPRPEAGYDQDCGGLSSTDASTGPGESSTGFVSSTTAYSSALEEASSAAAYSSAFEEISSAFEGLSSAAAQESSLFDGSSLVGESSEGVSSAVAESSAVEESSAMVLSYVSSEGTSSGIEEASSLQAIASSTAQEISSAEEISSADAVLSSAAEVSSADAGLSSDQAISSAVETISSAEAISSGAFVSSEQFALSSAQFEISSTLAASSGTFVSSEQFGISSDQDISSAVEAVSSAAAESLGQESLSPCDLKGCPDGVFNEATDPGLFALAGVADAISDLSSDADIGCAAGEGYTCGFEGSSSEVFPGFYQVSASWCCVANEQVMLEMILGFDADPGQQKQFYVAPGSNPHPLNQETELTDFYETSESSASGLDFPLPNRLANVAFTSGWPKRHCLEDGVSTIEVYGEFSGPITQPLIMTYKAFVSDLFYGGLPTFNVENATQPSLIKLDKIVITIDDCEYSSSAEESS